MLFECLPILRYTLLAKLHGLEGVIVGAAFNTALHYVERCSLPVIVMSAPDMSSASMICILYSADSCFVQASEATLESRCFSAS